MTSDKHENKTAAIGIDIGGTNTKIGLVTSAGKLIDRETATTPESRDPEAVVSVAAKAVRDLITRNKLTPVGAGVGAPGIVNRDRSRVVVAPNFPTWHDVPLPDLFERALALPVVMDNDVNAFGIGEFRWGAAVGLKHFIAAALGTGIGGAVFIDGKIYRGATGGAGEVGFTVISPDGPDVIGCQGVLEAYVGRRAFDKLAAELFPTGPFPTPRHITDMAAEGEPRARKIHEKLAAYLAEAAATWVNILNPEAVVLGGGTLAGADYFFEVFTEKLKKRARRCLVQELKVLPGKLGYYAGLLGAAALWFAEENSRR